MPKKLAAFLAGLALAVVLIEGGLALAYRGFVWLQASRNRVEAADEIRVLAIGESTTAVAGDGTGSYLTPETAYPAPLERILNSRQDRLRFRVLNNGVMGGTTDSVLDLLERTLPELRPQVIIAMMGIKDTADQRVNGGEGPPAWIRTLRLWQLWCWLREGEGLRRDAVVTEVRAVEDIPESMRGMAGPLRNYAMEARILGLPGGLDAAAVAELRVGLYYWYIGRSGRAERLLRAAVERYGVGYNLLARVLASAGRRDEAAELLERAAAEHPEEGMYRVVEAQLLIEQGALGEAEAALDTAEAELEGVDEPGIARSYIGITRAALYRERGAYQRALEALSDVVTPSWPADYRAIFPAPELLVESELGQIYLAMERWDLAERHLLKALDWSPRRHVNMWLLSKVYRETGQTEREAAVRRELLETTGRMAEYFELAKLFKRSGDGDRVPELMAEAVESIPSLAEGYRRLYALAGREGIQLIVMQYPSFSLQTLHRYAPPAEGVVFVDNEHVFDADPDAYFFEPRFPHSFSHYTEEGARVLAEHIADALLPLYSEDSARRAGPDVRP